VKIAYWLLQPLLWPHCAMQLEKVPSYTAAKVIYVFVSLWLNAYQGCAILFLLAPL
jgi:hypothetical protein